MSKVKKMAPSPEHFEQSQWIYFGFVMLTSYLLGSIYALLGPFFPEEAESKGLTASTYGTIMGFSKFVAFVVVPFLGVNLKLLGLRQCFTAGVYLSAGGAILFSSVAFINDYTGFLIAAYCFRIVDGLGICFLVTTYVIVTAVFPARASTVVGFSEAVYILGATTAPVIGGLIDENWGFTGVFLAFGLAQLANATLGYIFLPELSEAATAHILPPREALAVFRKFLTIPSLLLILLTSVVTGTGGDFINTILEPSIRHFMLTPVGVGLTFAIPGAMQLLDPAWGHILHSTKRTELVGVIGGAFAAVGALFIGPISFIPVIPTISLTRFGLMLFGIGQGALLITNFTKLIEESTRVLDSRTGLIAVSVYFQLTTSLGASIGSALSGLLYTDYGTRRASIYLFVVYGAVCIIYFIFLIRGSRGPNLLAKNMTMAEDKEASEKTPILNGN